MDTTEELKDSIASEKRLCAPSPHTLGNFAGNLCDGVKVWSMRGDAPNSGPTTARDFWQTYARDHEEMPVRFSTNGFFLHIYEDGGTDPETHICSVCLGGAEENA